MDVRTILYACISGVSGSVIYAIFSMVPAAKTWLDSFSSEVKREIIMGISAAIGVLAFLATVAMGYQYAPVGAQAWVEAIGNILIPILGTGMATFATATAWH